MEEKKEGKKRGRPKKVPSVRAAVWCLELYPDNEDHAKVLETLREGGYEYAASLHDSDTWTPEDESRDSSHVVGGLKKAHWHVIVKYANAVRCDTLVVEFGIEARWIQVCRNTKRALRYLIHADDPEKFQYDRGAVIGTMMDAFNEALAVEPSEGDRVVEMLDYIESLDRPISTAEFARYCARSGCWAVFRRAGAIFCRCLSEHNAVCERSDHHRRGVGEYADGLDRARFEGFVEGHHAQIAND